MKRVVLVGAGVLIAWIGLLLVLDVALVGRQTRGVSQRVGESLLATATIGDADLALVRGRLSLDQLAIRRDDVVGHLAIDVAELRCELGPFGWALVDSSCRELGVHGVRLEVSTAALFKLAHPARRPVRARRVVIDDAQLVFSPSALLPSLGRVAIDIEHAESGPTTFVTPLSWIFALEQLQATIELPAGIELHLTYDHGVLGAAGSLFGSTPVQLPLELPVVAATRDAHDEVQALIQLGKDVAEGLVAKRAEDWLRSKL
jgi:hypothetical protein